MKLITRKKREYDDDGLLPLVNIIFLLLIFFMIAGVIEKRIIKDDIELPSADLTKFDNKEITYSKEFSKNHYLLEPYMNQKVIKQLIDISAGWYRIEEDNGKLLFWDLRFGQMGMDVNNASFLWYYELNTEENGNVTAIKKQPEIKNFRLVFKELFNRIKGN